jgi:hypothetical protein
LKKFKIALALGAALVAADFAGTLLLSRSGLLFGRPMPPFGALTHPDQKVTVERMLSEPQTTAAFDPELGWTWRPSTAEGLDVINALGARGPREYERQPAAGKRRIVTFGDSFTFGDEVAAEATFQWLLEHQEPDTEVLNFGVSGYGTDQALLRFRSLGLLGADVACLGILLENIGRNVNRYRPLWNMRTGICLTKPRFVLDARDELVLVPQPYATRIELAEAILAERVLEDVAEHEYWLGRPPVPTGKLSSLVRVACGFLAYRERTPARLWRDEAGEPFRVTLALLAAFQAEARAAGARHAPILVFPAKEDLRNHALPGRPYWTGFFAELERRGIEFIDLVTPLAERARADGEEPPGASLYKGGHLSKVGNALVAQTLRDWLRARAE